MNKASRLVALLSVAALGLGGWAGQAGRVEKPQLIEHRCAGDQGRVPTPTSRTHKKIEVKVVVHDCPGRAIPMDGSIPGIPPLTPAEPHR